MQEIRLNTFQELMDPNFLPENFTGNILIGDNAVHKYKDGECYCRIYFDDIFWMKNGELHNENDLPAVEYQSGQKEWRHKGLLHRRFGPAREGPGFRAWYLMNSLYEPEDHFNKVFEEAFPEEQVWMLFNLELWTNTVSDV